MSGKRIGLPLIALAILSLSCLATTDALALQRTDTTESKSGDAIEEVVVTGKTLGQMRRDIAKAEARFFNAYNAINNNTMFDVNCRRETPTGTLISDQYCRAVFVDRALEDESRAFLEGHAGAPAQLMVQMRQPEFRKNVLKVVLEHPELARLLIERVEMQHRYEKELRARQTGRSRD